MKSRIPIKGAIKLHRIIILSDTQSICVLTDTLVHRVKVLEGYKRESLSLVPLSVHERLHLLHNTKLAKELSDILVCDLISQTSQEDFVHLLFPVSSGSTAASSSTLYSQELHHRRHQENTTTIRKKTRRRLEIYVPLVQPVWCPLPCRRVYVVDHFATHQRKRSGQKQQNQNLLI